MKEQKEKDKQILIDPELHQAAKIAATKDHMALKYWVARLIQAELEKELAR